MYLIRKPVELFISGHSASDDVKAGRGNLCVMGIIFPLSRSWCRIHLPEYGYDDRIRSGSDWLLWLETLSRGKGKIYYLDEILARYRRHAGNLTNLSGWKYEDQLITL